MKVSTFTACKAAMLRRTFPTLTTPEDLKRNGGLCRECDLCRGIDPDKWTATSLGTLDVGTSYVYEPLGGGDPERMDTWRVDTRDEPDVHGVAVWATVQMIDKDGNVRMTACGKPGWTRVLVRRS